MQLGADRICAIVLSLRNFSRLDEAEIKPIDIHEGIDSTLMILQSRLKASKNYKSVEVIKQYGALPKVECYAGQLNQAFMNLISNAIDALEGIRNRTSEQENDQHINRDPQIRISTTVVDQKRVEIRIADNGAGMAHETRKRIFDPFFTTKPIGKGTGLGLSISYQLVVERHNGSLDCWSELGQGTEFTLQVPIQLKQS